MIEDAIYTVLKNDSTVSGLVASRIYPVTLPQGPTYPAISYRFISETRHHAMGGDAGVVERRLQVDCLGESATAAGQLADAVTNALSRYMGTVTYTGGSTVIEDVYAEGVQDLFDFEARKYLRAVDFLVLYQG